MQLRRALLIVFALLGSSIDLASPLDNFLGDSRNYNYVEDNENDSENYIESQIATADGGGRNEEESEKDYVDASNRAMMLDQAEAPMPILTGSISLNIPMKNMSKPAGETARLVCEITGDPKPKYVWLKDGKIAAKDDRVVAQDTAWGHRLRIDGLTSKDEGWYTCVASNPFGSVNTSAYLKVSMKNSTQPSNRPTQTAQQQPVASSIHSKGDEFSIDNLAKEGFCQEFSGATCAIHLKNNMVVASSRKTTLSQGWREMRLAEIFDSISQLDNITSSSSCTPELLTSALCYFAFPTCVDAPSQTQAQAQAQAQVQKPMQVRTLCYSDCKHLTGVVCRNELDSLREHLREDFDVQLMLECQRLIPASSSSNNNNGMVHDSKTCRSLGILPQSTSAATPLAEDCYSQSGADYSGKAQTSQSGQPCRKWSTISEYAHVGNHAFCRNPNGERDAPWCFVGDKPERCDLPRCDPQVTENTDTAPETREASEERPAASNTVGEGDTVTSDSTVILVPSIASVVIVVVILIVLYIWRRSGSTSKSSAAFTFIGGQGHSTHGSRAPSSSRVNNSVTSSTAHSAKKTNTAASKASSVVSVIPTSVPDYPVSRIRFVQELGSGPFGKIYRGDLLSYVDATAFGNASSMPIFIKSLRPGASSKMQQDFQREIQLMSELLHPNLLNLIGVCMHDHPWCMLFEYVQFGDLHEFLVLHSPSQSDNLSLSDDNTITSLLQANRKTLTLADQVHIAKEVASGMEFLASRRFVHRDLAARNVLIGHNLSCKICDFGIAVDAYSCDYYKVQGGAVLLPVRWMAPEAVAHNQFSLETDVFSYGVLLWEIFSSGMQPYFGYSNTEVMEMVKDHQILTCPDECPVRMYALMVECWNLVPMQRPHFRDINARLGTWLVELESQDQLGLAHAPMVPYYLQQQAPPLERFISMQHNGSSPPTRAAATSMLTQEALECLNALTKSDYGSQPHFAMGNNNDGSVPNAYSAVGYGADSDIGLRSQNPLLFLQPAHRAIAAQSAASSGALHYGRQQNGSDLNLGGGGGAGVGGRRSAYQHAQSVTGTPEAVSYSRPARKGGLKPFLGHPAAAFQQIQPNSPPIVIEKHSSSSIINRNNLIYPQAVTSERLRRKNSGGSSRRSGRKLTSDYASFSGNGHQLLSGAPSTGLVYPSPFVSSSTTGGIRNPLDNHPLATTSAGAARYIPVSHPHSSGRSANDSDSESS